MFQQSDNFPNFFSKVTSSPYCFHQCDIFPDCFSNMTTSPTVFINVIYSLTVTAMWQLPRLFRWRGREGLCQHCDAFQNWRYPWLDKIFKKFSFRHINTFQISLISTRHSIKLLVASKYIKNITYQVFLAFVVLQSIIVASSADL